MLEPYFIRTALDTEFYDKYLAPRLPETVFDAHLHIRLPEHHKNVDPSQIAMDWAAQCCECMTAEDMHGYAKVFWPDRKFKVNALGTVTKGADHAGCNAYLAHMLREKKVDYAEMVLNPAWSDAFVEETLVEGNFTGYKPYPDMVTGQKGAEIPIPAFLPPSKMEILNRHKKAVTIHIPRAGRFADDNNVAELKKLADDYPDAKIIIAHFGRSYAEGVFEEGVKKFGPDYMKRFYFDVAAVLNPKVLEIAFQVMDMKKVIYGTDLPVFLWHGKRRWTRYEYFNLAREDFPWTTHEEGPEAEEQYTFFLYEQAKNILDICDKVGGGREMAADIFCNNAEALFASTVNE